MTRRSAIDADVVAEEEQSGGILQWSSLVDAILVAGHYCHQLVASTRDTTCRGWSGARILYNLNINGSRSMSLGHG